MQGARRPTSARLFDRKRRRGYRRRASHGKSRPGAGTLVSWGLRNGLKLWGGLFFLFAGLGLLLQGRDDRFREPPPFTDPRQALDLIHGDLPPLPPPPPPPLPPPPLAGASTTAAAADHGKIEGVVIPSRPQHPRHPGETNSAGERVSPAVPPPGPGDRVARAGVVGAPEHKKTEPLPKRPPPAEHGGGSSGGASAGGGEVSGVAGTTAGHQTRTSGKGGGGGGGGDGGGGGGGDGLGDFSDPADGVKLVYGGSGMGGGGVIPQAGPMEAFLAQGGKLPVLLLTCNRAELLEHTIDSLRGVRGLDMQSVMVLQDGTDEKVAALVREHGLYLKQNTVTPRLRGGAKAGEDGARRIAMHYKFALDHAFGRRPDAPAVVIVEDDLLFSPDFLEYLEANAPVLERDPTTLVLSAWNDNGYKGRVSDKAELKRTLYFPGLGWLFPRKLFNELGPTWPKEHWDHWLRDEKQHKGRECVYPEVPRTFHNGIKGTFMDKTMHDKLFKNIDYNTDPSFSWQSSKPPAPAGQNRNGNAPPAYLKGLRGNYESRVEARIRQARHINSLDDLPTSSSKRRGEQVVMWYTLQQTEEPPVRRGTKRKPQQPPFKPLSDVFGIWHEYRRGEHLGMHTFRYEGNSHIMLINAAKSPYVDLKPSGLLPATLDALRGGPSGAGGALKVVAGESASLSCDKICSAQGMRCDESTFERLNSCRILTENFPCTVCSESFGTEQPCYVEGDAPAMNFPGQCLVSSNPRASKCSASHHLTRRLCPCVPS